MNKGPSPLLAPSPDGDTIHVQHKKLTVHKATCVGPWGTKAAVPGTAGLTGTV